MDSVELQYLGQGWSFPPEFNVTGGTVSMLQDEADIQSSLLILLQTGLGERIMQPDYGCDLRKFLFEPVSASLEAEIKQMITHAILFYEARIKPINVTVSDADSDGTPYLEGRIDINLEYSVKGTNSRYNLVFPFYLQYNTTADNS